ncbi:FAD-dependent oxidoreductase [Nonomuraea typhae]|uniref:FAD-dependent oxidoreductase n=1 Tax=Nonomuraea typhae TaxID=2603600 RepID=A0ABW7YR03_9ACTN
MTQVIVMGGGIGGLCLAQGLRRAGVDVTVYERDRTPTAREQGYRIHINPAGSRALRACLPGPLWEAFVATAGDPGRGFGFFDERLRTLVMIEDDIAAQREEHAVSRLTLRQILLAGLGDAVVFGKEFVRYTPGDRVTAHFADGSTAAGDLLVGADGAGSRVRAQFMPGNERVATGAVGIGGKLELTDASRAWLPDRLTQGMNVIMGPRHFLFTAIFNRRRKPGEARELLGDDLRAAGLDPEPLFAGMEDRDYILWAFVTRENGRFEQESGARLQALVADAIRGWHPDLRRLVSGTAAETVMAFTLRTSVPVPAWPSGNVTLLGDAIHSMPPTGGIGGNTALRDAALLSGLLAERPAGEAVAAYESQMRAYGFAAVKEANANCEQAVAGRLGRIRDRAFLRACGAIPSLRRAVFGNRRDEPA